MSAGSPPRGGAAPRPARDSCLWALFGLLGLLLALYLAFPRLDADQAITGLMGVYVLRGEFPVFFWMQDHAGVPESYAAAPLFFLFGISRRVLDLVPALGTLALALAVYRTGALLFGRGAGLLGILFTTVVSAYVAANYTLARSYYVEHLVVGQVVLLGAALWLARPLSEPARCRVAIAMGLAGGLGLYFNFQIVDALIPALLALLLMEPGLPLRRAAWLGVGAFLLGSLPFWVYNLTHDWATVATGARFQGRLSGLGDRADPGRRSAPGRPRRPIRHGPALPSARPPRLDDPADRGRRRPAPPGPDRRGNRTPAPRRRRKPARRFS